MGFSNKNILRARRRWVLSHSVVIFAVALPFLRNPSRRFSSSGIYLFARRVRSKMNEKYTYNGYAHSEADHFYNQRMYLTCLYEFTFFCDYEVLLINDRYYTLGKKKKKERRAGKETRIFFVFSAPPPSSSSESMNVLLRWRWWWIFFSSYRFFLKKKKKNLKNRQRSTRVGAGREPRAICGLNPFARTAAGRGRVTGAGRWRRRRIVLGATCGRGQEIIIIT